MSMPKETPAHVQVAEAGFGAAVEAKGFKRVGKTHWRLDGDGIVHHVRLNRGYTSIPGSFRDALGMDFPEFWKLAELCGHETSSDKLPGTSIHCHFAGADVFVPIDRDVQFDNWKGLYGNPDHRSLWRDIRDLFKPPPNFNKAFYKMPAGYRKNLDAGGRVDAEAWILQDLTPEELVSSITECWERGYWEARGHQTSFQIVYDEIFREAIEERASFSANHFIYAYMVGDLHLIQQMADRQIARLDRTLEDIHQKIYANCIRPVSRVDWKVERDTHAGWRAIRDAAMSHFADPRRALLRMKKMSEALGIELKMPYVDRQPVDDWDKRIEERMAGIDYDSRLHP